jgi:hypothetical protein
MSSTTRACGASTNGGPPPPPLRRPPCRACSSSAAQCHRQPCWHIPPCEASWWPPSDPPGGVAAAVAAALTARAAAVAAAASPGANPPPDPRGAHHRRARRRACSGLRPTRRTCRSQATQPLRLTWRWAGLTTLHPIRLATWGPSVRQPARHRGTAPPATRPPGAIPPDVRVAPAELRSAARAGCRGCCGAARRPCGCHGGPSTRSRWTCQLDALFSAETFARTRRAGAAWPELHTAAGQRHVDAPGLPPPAGPLLQPTTRCADGRPNLERWLPAPPPRRRSHAASRGASRGRHHTHVGVARNIYRRRAAATPEPALDSNTLNLHNVLGSVQYCSISFQYFTSTIFKE